ncbi:MAG: hypothetical protein WDO19_03125 [Bacteroidota bacterium]
MLNDRSIPIVCKIIAEGFRIHFTVIGYSIASLNSWQIGSPLLTFRKDSTGKQSFITTGNGSTTHTNK